MNRVVAAIAGGALLVSWSVAARAQIGAESTVVLPAGEVPLLSISLAPVDGGAWAGTLETERFTFGALSGGAVVTVDGGAPQATDGPTFVVSSLSPGLHEIVVALVDPEQRVFADDAGRLVAERFIIEVPPGPFPTNTQAAEVNLVEGNVAGEVTTVRASFNSGVSVRWTTDSEVELHVHGFDIEIGLQPELPTTIMFVADMYGRFPTELHAAGAEATVLFVEVAP